MITGVLRMNPASALGPSSGHGLVMVHLIGELSAFCKSNISVTLFLQVLINDGRVFAMLSVDFSALHLDRWMINAQHPPY
jgi:hypothetical protein